MFVGVAWPVERECGRVGDTKRRQARYLPGFKSGDPCGRYLFHRDQRAVMVYFTSSNGDQHG